MASTARGGRCRNFVEYGQPTRVSLWQVSDGAVVQGYDLDDDQDLRAAVSAGPDPDAEALRARWLRQRCELHQYRKPDAPDFCPPEWRAFDPVQDRSMTFTEPALEDHLPGGRGVQPLPTPRWPLR